MIERGTLLGDAIHAILWYPFRQPHHRTFPRGQQIPSCYTKAVVIKYYQAKNI